MALLIHESQVRKYGLLASTVPLLFWVVDGVFRRIQRSFIARYEDISGFVNSEGFLRAVQSGTPTGFPVVPGTK